MFATKYVNIFLYFDILETEEKPLAFCFPSQCVLDWGFQAECARALRLLKKAQLPWHRSKKAVQLRAKLVVSAMGGDKGKKLGEKPKKKQSATAVPPDVPGVPDDVPPGADDDVEKGDMFASDVELRDDSSGGSDTDTSADEDQDDAGEHAAGGADDPPPKMGPLPGHLDQYAIDDADGSHIGIIKVDKVHKSFNAHCCQLGGCGCKDHRTPTVKECRLNRDHKKRPLGFLVQWLRQGYCYENRNDHKLSVMVITSEDQRLCRDWMHRQVALENLLKQEAEWLGLAWTGPATVAEHAGD